MAEGFEKFKQITAEVCSKYATIQEAKMMHAPALAYQGKVFSFFSKKTQGMVFKLGKDYEISRFEGKITPFNPFKNKGPLAGWFELPESQQEHWPSFTQNALQCIIKE